jgi:hypothetical protein
MVPDPAHYLLVSIADRPPLVLPGGLKGENYGMRLSSAVSWRER